MFGPDILVTPVLNVNEHVTTAYIPPLHGGDVGWYDLWSGAEEHRSGVTELETTTYQISTHVKAGSIIPMLVSRVFVWQLGKFGADLWFGITPC